MSTKTTGTTANDRIVWVDCEMTGLDTDTDALIEVAVLVTDADLNVLGDGVDVVVRPPQPAIDQMGEFVRNMHTTSGLLDILESGMTLEAAQQLCLDYVKKWVPEAGKAPLAGNSVGTDRLFLTRDLPEFEKFLSYRTIDVSSFKELAKRWFPRIYFNTPKKHGGHRALADIQESIAELGFYREVMLVPNPGPSSDQVRAISAKHEIKPAEIEVQG